jgi:hypothetical protein
VSAIIRSQSQVSGTVSSGTGFTLQETSAAPQAGDVRFLFFNVSSGNTITPPSGWTVYVNAQVGAGTLLVASKPWVAGVGSEVVNFTTASQIGIELISVTGLDTAATPQVVTNGSATNGTTLTTGSVTPATADGLLLAYFVASLSANATTATMSNPAALTGFTDTERSTVSAASYVLRVSSVGITSTATLGPYTATSSGAGTWRTALVAIPSATTTTGAANFLPYLGLGTGVSR